ncbi:hypothetical protein GWI33_011903 [Rhynchophorus ferrugineus]|uniref:Uncharacterized protein n=1 Tax=Rhynchophorus ferrugineus TaxID=354439 RepID=A0A834IC50_RHYFE|nr:hypothetical protein GWI33_011903 [Rhynchophorus ferrugineus]
MKTNPENAAAISLSEPPPDPRTYLTGIKVNSPLLALTNDHVLHPDKCAADPDNFPGGNYFAIAPAFGIVGGAGKFCASMLPVIDETRYQNYFMSIDRYGLSEG